MNISDILISVALLLNTISIHRMWKRIDNMESWIKYLLRKDIGYRTYMRHKTELQTKREDE